MPLPASIEILGVTSPINFTAGSSTIVVGANGSGKTKLAVECERLLGESAHRISAQRMLAIDPSVEKTSEEAARGQLRYGYPKPSDYGSLTQAREINRWGQGAPRFILNDAGALLQVLFGEQANTAVAAYNASADGVPVAGSDTLMRQLKAIFHRVLPSRDLTITADDISISVVDAAERDGPYNVTQMSDGEKAVFYMIGQALVADKGSVFIMDEPEIHIHRSILGRLWDELEASRPDCAFLLITHDLEFAASRAGAKYVVRSYSPATGWVMDTVPEAAGFSEDVVTLILGSRKPVLFVEGEQGSLDLAFYRACYPSWTIVPRGGCESVIHSVITMRQNSSLTRIQCAGLVDADDRDDRDSANLAAKGVYVLPVSEIENLLLLPTVSRAILEMNHHDGDEVEARINSLQAAILADALVEENVNEVVLGFCRRRIDRVLKQIDLSADKSIPDLISSYESRTAELDVSSLAAEIQAKIAAAAASGDIATLLTIYDRKRPLLAFASSRLCGWKLDVFTAWVVRAIQSKSDDRLRRALSSVLPVITPA